MMTNKASGSKRKCQGKIRDVRAATSTVSAKSKNSATCIEYGRDVTSIWSSIVSANATGLQRAIANGGRPGKKSCTCSSSASAKATSSQTANRGRQGKAVTTSIASASAKATSSQGAYRGSKGKKVQTSSTSRTTSSMAKATSSQVAAYKGRKGKVQTSSTFSETTTQFQTVGVEITSFGSKVVHEQGVIRVTSSSTFRKGAK